MKSGGSAIPQRFRSRLEREELAGDDPGARSPGGREEEDIEADEAELGDDGRVVLNSSGISCRRNNVLGDSHTQSTNQKDRASSKLINGVEAGERADNIDDIRNDREQERAWQGRCSIVRKIRCSLSKISQTSVDYMH